ncbi:MULTISPECIES: Clp protease/crotonase-like domain-containing protein [Mycolicibacter]|uniref:Uncharacterized protein n=2 Tax=Mycolicibacter TaxID=1073531 RepID=A0ABU5XM56_9MYCO|nr:MULTISPECIES: hypothetical protein [unclassified Mycolicibacter]MEB3023365.1 hypothetical protein [Mycolicibacter sp. MYC098]MEB3033707.1 hypothetical protein [Mycolicibacter sp. MYC340]
MGFWEEIKQVLAEAAQAKTADELIAAVRKGPNQDSGSGDAFFAGSGGDDQLVEALYDAGPWSITWREGDYHWRATSSVDGSVIEYIEGDVYRRTT